jgi:rubrerythrin
MAGIDIFECKKCLKTFGVGIDVDYSQYYRKKGLTEDQAFQEYYKELRSLGATAIHLKEKPDTCPYCKDSHIDELNLTRRGGCMIIYDCRKCRKRFSVGLQSAYREVLAYLGVPKGKIFGHYRKIEDLLYAQDPKSYLSDYQVLHVLSTNTCPYCNADRRYFEEVLYCLG